MSIKEHARRIAVAHKGLAWLRYDGTSQKHSPRDDETVDEGFPGKMANTRADAVEAFAALVGRRDVPAAALKSCQYIFPVSSCVAATEEALEAAVATECDAAVRDPSSKLSASSCNGSSTRWYALRLTMPLSVRIRKLIKPSSLAERRLVEKVRREEAPSSCTRARLFTSAAARILPKSESKVLSALFCHEIQYELNMIARAYYSGV